MVDQKEFVLIVIHFQVPRNHLLDDYKAIKTIQSIYRSPILDIQIHDIFLVFAFDELESQFLVPLHDIFVRMQCEHPATYIFGKNYRLVDRPRDHVRSDPSIFIIFMRCNLA